MHVGTVAQLGKLRQVFKAVPELTHLVKMFSFGWSMDGDWVKVKDYPAELGSLLELAFCDRRKIWAQLAHQRGCPIEMDDRSRIQDRYFGDGNTRFHEPGRHSPAGPTRGSGPDGNGEDLHIKSAGELVDCINEIILQMTSLEKFLWHAEILPMPLEACNALSQRSFLTDLSINMSTHRFNVHAREC